MKFAYFPGCSAKATTKENDVSTRRVAEILGIELIELESAACCGSRELRALDRRLTTALNARTLAQAERQGLNILTICSTCQLNLAQDNERLRADAGLREWVNREALAPINLSYTGTLKVEHFLWLLVDRYDRNQLRAKITRPLGDLRVATFPCCHLFRPASAHPGFDDPFHPHVMDLLVEVLGATPVEYGGKALCCGFHALLVDETSPVRMSGAILEEAKQQGANCIVTASPFCHTMFDMHQSASEKAIGRALGLPVLHLSQLLGLAFGLSPEQLGFSRHLVSPANLL